MKKFKTAREAREALAAKSTALHEIFEQAGPDYDLDKVTALAAFPDTAAKAAEIKRLNQELTEVGKEHDDWAELERAHQAAEKAHRDSTEPVRGLPHPTGERREADQRSLGRIFAQSDAYRRFGSSGLATWPAVVDVPQRSFQAAVFRTGAGWDPDEPRLDRVELKPERPIAVVDHIPMLPTSADTIRYMEETTFTNNAAETAESTATTASDLIPEAALALTERTKPVEWLPVFLPVTLQQLEDVEGIEAYVNSRLSFMIRQRLDSQLLVGNGTTPNILGTESVSGIQTQALGADPIPDAIYKCMRLIRDDGFAEPSVVFIRPSKWETIRLLRTADGIYIWGSPSEAGPERIWGKPVVQTTAPTATKAVIGAYNAYSALYVKRGITLAVSDSHAHYFTRGMLAIRADMRISMVHFRPKAFGVVTGL